MSKEARITITLQEPELLTLLILCEQTKKSKAEVIIHSLSILKSVLKVEANRRARENVSSEWLFPDDTMDEVQK